MNCPTVITSYYGGQYSMIEYIWFASLLLTHFVFLFILPSDQDDGICVILMILIVLLCCCICHKKKGKHKLNLDYQIISFS